MIFIVQGETFISDMYNLVSDLLYVQESREQGLVSVGFLRRIEMQLCYQGAGEALQSETETLLISAQGPLCFGFCF